MKIIDISISITNQTVVYPNNPAVQIENFAKMPEASSNLTKITFGSHTATHIDAPSHTILAGAGLETYPLENFIGPAKVFDFRYLMGGELITIADFEKAAENAKAAENNENLVVKAGDRILIKTSNSLRGYAEFYEDFVALDGDCADWLAAQNIALIGVDYLSIKQRGSTDNRAHNAFLSKNIPIVEGLNLKEVSAGLYDLFCPPLKLDDFDGAPCRAVLIDRTHLNSKI